MKRDVKGGQTNNEPTGEHRKRLHTGRGNQGTRNSWVKEGETQGQQVNTIRHTRETNDREENTGRRTRQETRRKTFQNKSGK